MLQRWPYRIAIARMRPLATGIMTAIALFMAPDSLQPTRAEADSAPQHLLWEIESSTSTVYLLGSIHFFERRPVSLT